MKRSYFRAGLNQLGPPRRANFIQPPGALTSIKKPIRNRAAYNKAINATHKVIEYRILLPKKARLELATKKGGAKKKITIPKLTFLEGGE